MKNLCPEEQQNHGRGTCKKVTVVWKLNMEEGVKELFCIAQNPKVALGIRQHYLEEAQMYGIEPKHYVFWEDQVVVWSRSVFPDLYRIYDVNAKKVVFGGRGTKNGGQYVKVGAARTYAKKLVKEGVMKEWVIQKYNRQRKRWELSDQSSTKAKLKLFDRGYKYED